MKKLILTLSFISILLISIFFALMAAIDFEQASRHFFTNNKLESDKLTLKEVKINKYFRPSATIQEINYAGIAQLKEVHVNFSLLSLLTLTPKIADIKITEASIFSNQDEVNLVNHDRFIAELIKGKGLETDLFIQKVQFFEKDQDLIIKIDDFQLTTSNYSNKIIFAGNLEQGGVIEGDFQQKDATTLFNLELTSLDHHIILQETYQNNNFTNGKATITSKNITRQLGELLPDINNLTKKLDSTQKIQTEFDLKPAENALKLENIKINSAIISGQGTIMLSRVKDTPSEINLYFDQLDLASWRENDEKPINQSLAKNYSKFDLVKNNFKGSVDIKLVKLSQQEQLENVKLSLLTTNNQLLIENFSGTINAADSFKINGIIKQNKFRSLFDGNIELAHHDLNQLLQIFGQSVEANTPKLAFNLQAELKLSSVDFSLRQLLLKLDETTIDGNLSVKFIGKSIRTNSNFNLNQIRLDDPALPIIKNTITYFNSLVNDMHKDDYANKFIPIRKINMIGNHNIKINQLLFQQQKFDKVRFNLKTAPSTIALEQLYFENGEDWFDLDLNLSAQALKPIISIIIHNGRFKTDLLSPVGLLDIRKKLLNDYDLDKISILTSVAFQELYSDNFALGRIRFSAKNDGNLLEIPQIDADMFGGRMKSSGSLLLEPCNFNFVFSLSSAQLDKINNILPPHLVPAIGSVSANGMWSSNGNTLEQLLYNLYIRSDAIIKGARINNFAVDDFVNLISPVEYNSNNLIRDAKNAILTGRTDIERAETSIEMSTGKITLAAGKLKTKNTTASFAGMIDLYKYQLETDSIFSFALAKNSYGGRLINYTPNNIRVKATGELNSPKKDVDVTDLAKFLQSRSIR